MVMGNPGQLRHRTCFKCARCFTQLTLANYYETEHGQFCCETCPDEEKNNDSTDKPEEKESRIPCLSPNKEAEDSSSSDSESDSELSDIGTSQPSSPSLSQKGDSSSVTSSTTNTNSTKSNDGAVNPLAKPPRLFTHSAQGDSSVLNSQTVSDGLEDNKLTDESKSIDTGQDNEVECSARDNSIPTIPSRDVLEEDEIQEENLSNGKNNICGSRVSALKKAFESEETKSNASDQKLSLSRQNSKLNNIEGDSISNEVKLSEPQIEDGKLEIGDVDLNVEISIEDSKMHKEIESETIPSVDNKQNINIPQSTQESLNPFGDVSEDESLSTTEEHSRSSPKQDDIKSEDKTSDSIKPEYPDELNPFDADENKTKIEKNITREDKSSESNNEAIPSLKVSKPISDNPFDNESDEDDDKAKEVPKKSLNPFGSDDEDSHSIGSGTSSLSPRSKVSRPPRPPPPTLLRESPLKKLSCPPSPSPSTRSSSSDQGALRLKKKSRQAPAPPPSEAKSPARDLRPKKLDTMEGDLKMAMLKKILEQNSKDEAFSLKVQKDLKNHSSKMMADKMQHADNGALTPKSERGEWRRKKGPAPSRPMPQKRAIRKLPMRQIQQELTDIDVKQTELERQGVLIETIIRERTETPPLESTSPDTTNESESSSNNQDKPYTSLSSNSSTHSGAEVEDLILQLFELVNEKNELFRRQTELMYLKREKRLEEEYAELEFQIRCLMMKSPSERTEVDAEQEEKLIERLISVVEQRDAVVNCLEMERQREAIEDETIASHMVKYQDQHIDGIVDEDASNVVDKDTKKKRLKLKKIDHLLKKSHGIKKKKKAKKNKEESAPGARDDDKDVDESIEVVKKQKKKWFKKSPLNNTVT